MDNKPAPQGAAHVHSIHDQRSSLRHATECADTTAHAQRAKHSESGAKRHSLTAVRTGEKEENCWKWRTLESAA